MPQCTTLLTASKALLDRLEAVSFPLDEMNLKEAAESDKPSTKG